MKQLALKLNVPLPNRPALPVTSPIDPETITDKFMYRIILSWQLTSLDAHVRAIIETIRNESLRELWSGLLNAELEYYDKYLKYVKNEGLDKSSPNLWGASDLIVIRIILKIWIKGRHLSSLKSLSYK